MSHPVLVLILMCCPKSRRLALLNTGTSCVSASSSCTGLGPTFSSTRPTTERVTPNRFPIHPWERPYAAQRTA